MYTSQTRHVPELRRGFSRSILSSEGTGDGFSIQVYVPRPAQGLGRQVPFEPQLWRVVKQQQRDCMGNAQQWGRHMPVIAQHACPSLPICPAPYGQDTLETWK